MNFRSILKKYLEGNCKFSMHYVRQYAEALDYVIWEANPATMR